MDLIINNDYDSDRDLDNIHRTLRKSNSYNLTTEVVWSALTAIRDNPDITTLQAMEIGYNEWVK